jgi:hypothetical protein
MQPFEDPETDTQFPMDLGENWRKPARKTMRTANPNAVPVGRRKAYEAGAPMSAAQQANPRMAAAKKRAMAGAGVPEDAMGMPGGGKAPGGLEGLAAMQGAMRGGAMPGTMGGKVAEMPFEDPAMRRLDRQRKAVGMMNIA